MNISNVPYLMQLDNDRNPYGSCNCTCVAMAMSFENIRLNKNRNFGCPEGTQLEDYLQCVLEENDRDRHVPEDLEWLMTHFEIKCRFIPNATWEEVKNHLQSGKICINHNYLTKSGHIVVIRGYDDYGLLINDPYGEYYPDGYDTSVSGENIPISWEAVYERMGTDGDLWIHFVG